MITRDYFYLKYHYIVMVLTCCVSAFMSDLGITLTTFLKISMGYICNRLQTSLPKVVKVVKVITYSSATPTTSGTYIGDHRNKVITY